MLLDEVAFTCNSKLSCSICFKCEERRERRHEKLKEGKRKKESDVFAIGLL